MGVGGCCHVLLQPQEGAPPPAEYDIHAMIQQARQKQVDIIVFQAMGTPHWGQCCLSLFCLQRAVTYCASIRCSRKIASAANPDPAVDCLPACNSIFEGVGIYHSFPGYLRNAGTHGVLAFDICA